MRLNQIEILQNVVALCGKGHAFDKAAFENELRLKNAEHKEVADRNAALVKQLDLAKAQSAAKAVEAELLRLELGELKAKLATSDEG